MSKSMVTYIATHETKSPLRHSEIVENGIEPSKEHFARQLVIKAQDELGIIPDGFPGATPEERLRDYGYTITSKTSTLHITN
ncbi:hypothetical protein [Comamonas koreensis]|uniref:Uncharacterized protein n=1 Tax=Comamonas koreensis TaxID=160825 RepID=A0AAW4XUI2_9BURK|nr:hypothetical protein [Comamonas koreensis]MCD2164881.1 hypothetical protein [Comamonas koreensis]